MATVDVTTVVLIASQAREFVGLERVLGNVERKNWDLPYSAVLTGNQTRFVAAAAGAGRKNARRAAERALAETKSDILVSTGFCGALDPFLRIGDVVAMAHVCEEDSLSTPDARTVLGVDRVIVTVAEKARLRESTGAAIVDMESHELARVAEERGIRFLAVRVISDTAHEDLAVDFNQARRADGTISTAAVFALALRRPLSAVPALIRLARASKVASEKLGEFLAGYRF